MNRTLRKCCAALLAILAVYAAPAAEKTVYPAAENIFAAFRACPVSAVRVVILGQDPYHEPGQAMGLSFSVPDNLSSSVVKSIVDLLGSFVGPARVKHSAFRGKTAGRI